jgi:RNA polymerase sigma-70 factor (ECF subfamily)
MFFKKKNIEQEFESNSFENKFKDGSVDAFQVLFHKHNLGVYRYCAKILGDSSLAKDATQETFIKVYENRKNYTGNNFAAWLYTIAKNTCLNYQRNRKDFVEYVEGTRPNYINEDVFLKEYIDNMIEKLPETYREVIILREYEEFSYEEIAQILDLDINLIKIRVHRARKILKKLLNPIVREINEI